MRILIAGGAGYIGTVLAPRLAARGYAVTVADLGWFGNHLPREIPLVCKDVVFLTEADLTGTDVVIFLGGLSNDPMAEFSPALNYVHNAAAPATLAYLAKRAGVHRFILASSCSVYGFTEDELWDEDSPTTTAHAYGISKLQAEAGVHHLQDPSFSVIILRKGTVCGYSPRMRLDLVVNTMFKTALQDMVVSPSTTHLSGGPSWPSRMRRPRTCAPSRRLPLVSGTFNVASENTTLGALADQVAESLTRNLGLEPELRDPREGRRAQLQSDRGSGAGAARLQAQLRHNDKIVWDLIQNRTAFADLDNPAYYNITTFRALTADRIGASRLTALASVEA